MAYYYTLDSDNYFVRWSVGAAFSGCSTLPDGVAVPDALLQCSCNVRAYKYTNGVIVYDSDRENNTGIVAPSGGGSGGGKDGVSCTHSWNGTTLTVTSASGTSSADLKGEKGDVGTAFVPAVDNSGNLSWTNGGGLENPDTINIVDAVLAALPDGDGVGY